MRWTRIASLVRRDYRCFQNSRWKWMEVFYFPITSVIIWGLFALWSHELGTELGKIAVILNIFWSYVYIVQSTADIQVNEDMWAKSGRNVFAAGVTVWEYITAHSLFSLLVSIPALLLILLVSYVFFGLNFMVAQPLQTLHLLTITAFVGVTWGIIIGAILFLAGRDFAFLSWSVFQLFIMLSFPLFPVSLLPTGVQTIAGLMPLTSIFEAVRHFAVGESIVLGKAWILSVMYFAFSLLFYWWATDYAKKTGKLVKSF
ncbi:ABC transporter permease [Candidatus Woesearchaeota archaeon]|nr:ABC transporter permease [Candidatus Woesearchaeota archaeon]